MSALSHYGNHERLQAASLRKSFLPERDIPWESGVDQGPPAVLPEAAISIAGTPRFDELTEKQLCALARHEVAAFLSAFIRFEGVLNEYLSREVRTATPTNPRSPYLLQIIEEEARHSRMFARLIDSLGVGFYPRFGVLGAVEAAATRLILGWRPLFYAAMLAVECITDRLLAIVLEGSKSDLVRAVAQIHRVEEARHIDFASAEVSRQIGRASKAGKFALSLLGPVLAFLIYEFLTPPVVYVRSGVSRTRAGSWRLWWQRQRSRANRARRSGCVARIHHVLLEAGAATGPSALMWKRIHSQS